MGKNLKGQEIGKGISQRPDKTYRARYVNSLGKRVEESFTNLKDAQAWLNAERAIKTCLSKSKSPDMKVDEFFKICDRFGRNFGVEFQFYHTAEFHFNDNHKCLLCINLYFYHILICIITYPTGKVNPKIYKKEYKR